MGQGRGAGLGALDVLLLGEWVSMCVKLGLCSQLNPTRTK